MVQLLGKRGHVRRIRAGLSLRARRRRCSRALRTVLLILLVLAGPALAEPLVFEPEEKSDRLYPLKRGLMLVGKSSHPLFGAWWRPPEGLWQVRFFASSKDVKELELSFLAVRRTFPLTEEGADYVFHSPWDPQWGDGPVAFRCGGAGTVVLRKLTMAKVDDGEVAPGLSTDLESEPKMPRAAYAVLWDQLGEQAKVKAEILEDDALRHLALHRALAFERRSDEPTGPPLRRWLQNGVECAEWDRVLSLVNLTLKEAEVELPHDKGKTVLKPYEARFVSP